MIATIGTCTFFGTPALVVRAAGAHDDGVTTKAHETVVAVSGDGLGVASGSIAFHGDDVSAPTRLAAP